jgi:uncharacterized protein YjbJ (UPF0337 family)
MKGQSMSKNTVEGAGKQAVGAIKEVIGKVSGNEKLQAEGAVEKAMGSAQSTVGKAQDKVNETLKR